MNDLSRAIPDPDVLVSLEPEELGAKLLFVLRQHNFDRGMFSLGRVIGDLWNIIPLPGQQLPYPRDRRDDIDAALSEAWVWLEAQGLIVPAGDNGRNGWRILSRRAKRFENEAEFTRYAVARTLPKDVLHSWIANTVCLAFMRGDFDVAVFQAMKAVEVSVRLALAWETMSLGLR